MKQPKAGFSFIELLIGIVLSCLIMTGAYKLTGTISLQSNREMRKTQINVNVTKWFDRMTIQMANAIDFPNASGTVFGNLPKTLSGPPWNCPSNMVELSNILGGVSLFIPHGIVPLPQQGVADIDQGGYLTILEPSAPPPDGGAGIDNVAYDAIRIAYFPDGSNPIPVAAAVLRGTGYTNIKLSAGDITKFSVGDFAIIFDTQTRELFRVTSITVANELRHLTNSFWNTKFLHDFSTSAFVQKVQLITYAFDPSSNEIVFDNHVQDDGFNSSTHTFGSPQTRTLNWGVVASKVTSFKIFYTYSSAAIGNGTLTETRKPIAALPVSYDMAECPNQVGYPYFRNIRVEVTLEPPIGSTSPDTISLSRSITPELLRRDTLPEDITNDSPVYVVGAAVPTSPPSGGTQYLGNNSGGF